MSVEYDAYWLRPDMDALYKRASRAASTLLLAVARRAAKSAAMRRSGSGCLGELLGERFEFVGHFLACLAVAHLTLSGTALPKHTSAHRRADALEAVFDTRWIVRLTNR
jgi:hypothetical protein